MKIQMFPVMLMILSCALSALADIPSPAYISDITQKGQDVLINISDSDYAWHSAGGFDYSIARVRSPELCDYVFILRMDDIFSGDTIEKGSYCAGWQNDEDCGNDAGVDGGCEDCDEDGVPECAGWCECCYYRIQFVDRCVQPGNYEYYLMIPSDPSDSDPHETYAIDTDRNNIVFESIDEQLVLQAVTFEVTDSVKQCNRPENIESENQCEDAAGSGASCSHPGNDNKCDCQALILLFAMSLIGLYFLRKKPYY